MDDKEKKYAIVIGLLAVVIIAMVWARWWSCDCNSRQGYEEVRNLPVYKGNQVVNGSIGSAYRDPRNYV